MKDSSPPRHSMTRCGGGGTNSALPGRVRTIQFCDRRNAPGCLSSPRPFESRISWISQIRRRRKESLRAGAAARGSSRRRSWRLRACRQFARRGLPAPLRIATGRTGRIVCPRSGRTAEPLCRKKCDQPHGRLTEAVRRGTGFLTVSRPISALPVRRSVPCLGSPAPSARR